MLHRSFMSVSTALSILFAGSLAQAGTARYEFNGDLTSTTGQAALEAVGYPGVAGAGTPTFEADTIGGQNAQVARLPKGTALVVRHGFPSNGGGGYLNQYTIVMDVKLPTIDWTSLLQTNEAYDDPTSSFNLADSNDGDWFVNPTGGIGIDGNYGGTVAANTWYRLALVVNTVAGTYTAYIDGNQVQQNTGLGLDGRFSAYTSTDPDPYDWFFLFADETGGAAEMGEIVINSFQVEDRALTGEEIGALGGPDADGIGGPVPPAPALNGIGAAALAVVFFAVAIVAMRKKKLLATAGA